MTDRWLDTAVRAARAAAAIQLYHLNSPDLGIGIKSSRTDIVTRVDRECEERIRQVILQAHPDHVILGEEGGEVGQSGSKYRWIVDPLDGTINYAHGFPVFCVSIALEVDGVVQLGAVLDGTRNELFTAVRGRGAWLNGERIRPTTTSVPSEALLATGFSYASEEVVRNLEIFGRVMAQVRAIRRPGAGALDLCYVACGRYDAFWELTLQPWDVAAGILVIQEAGGIVTGGQGEPYRLGNPVVVASNGVLHEQLVAMLSIPA